MHWDNGTFYQAYLFQGNSFAKDLCRVYTEMFAWSSYLFESIGKIKQESILSDDYYDLDRYIYKLLSWKFAHMDIWR